MKKIKSWKILGALAAFCVVGFAVACTPANNSSSNAGNSSTNEVGTLTLNKTAITIDLLEEVSLVATQEDLTGVLVWSSSNEAIVTVTNEGKVKGLQEGTATVTVACGDYTAQCTVVVEASGAIPVLSVDGVEDAVSLL